MEHTDSSIYKLCYERSYRRTDEKQLQTVMWDKIIIYQFSVQSTVTFAAEICVINNKNQREVLAIKNSSNN